VLREIGNVYQQDPGMRRRWFCDDYFDLFVWENPQGQIVGFQLCYDLAARQRALSWRENTGYSHHRIDSGEHSTLKNMTPIMADDGVLPLPAVLEKFDVSAARIEARVRDFVRERLLEYGAKAAAALDKPATRA
jgi:hypothetical protein